MFLVLRMKPCNASFSNHLLSPLYHVRKYMIIHVNKKISHTHNNLSLLVKIIYSDSWHLKCAPFLQKQILHLVEFLIGNINS